MTAPKGKRSPAPEPEESAEPVDKFPPPPHLDGDAATIWTEICNAHHDPARIVGPDLEAYCGQVAVQRDARKRIAREGMIVADSRGTPTPHPAIQIEQKAQAEIRAWGDKFRGRTPRPAAQPRRERER